MSNVRIWGLLKKPVASWAAFTALCIGFVLGIAFGMPLFNLELPRSTAMIAGSSIGAFIAVGLAGWIAERKERERFNNGQEMLFYLLGAVTNRINDVNDALIRFTVAERVKDEEKKAAAFSEICMRMRKCARAVDRAVSRFERIVQSLCDIDPLLGVAAVDSIEIFKDSGAEVITLADSSESLTYISSKDEYVDKIRIPVAELNNDIQVVMNRILNGARF